MDTREAARRWAREWAHAWREHDAARVAALYARSARFRSSPFRELRDPGDYAAWAFASEEAGAEVTFAEPVVVEGFRAVVEWWAVVRAPGSRETTIAGASVLTFGDDGLVVAQRDYWNDADERRDPYDGWGR